MAFVANDNQQLALTDSTLNLTQREKRVLEKSWAKTFAEKVFPAIDESIFSVLYSDKASRPNTPVNVIVGALILKEALGDNDDELVEALMFDVRYQYALHTTSFEEQPLSDRTLSRFRARVLAYETEHDVDLIHECIVKMAKEIAEFMGISPNRQRMDSLMIAANIKNFRKKEEVENSSEVLLNPSDPEATFRYKAGGKNLGYVGNVVESVGEKGSLITDYAYEKNIYADNQFMKDYLERQDTFDDRAFLVADGAYSGETNSQIAASHNLKLVTTNFTGRKPDEIYADFKFSDDGHFLLECINGCTPSECIYDFGNDRSVAYFKTEECSSCLYKDRCQPRFLKTRVRKEVSWKAVGRAKQLQYMKTEEFSRYARFRNGVEAIPSLLRRRYNVDKIPTHGKNRTRFHFGFKIAALDFQKLFDSCVPKIEVE